MIILAGPESVLAPLLQVIRAPVVRERLLEGRGRAACLLVVRANLGKTVNIQPCISEGLRSRGKNLKNIEDNNFIA